MKPPRKSWARPLADLVAGALDPVVAKQGFGQSDVILNWDDIVGARLAAVCEPIRLQWPVRPKNAPPQRAPEPATLILRVESGFALELQHMAGLLIERVNTRLGWRCIGKISLRQGPLPRATPAPERRRPPGAEAQLAAAAATQGVDHADLRDALTRLGARVLESRKTGQG
jgi:hypothetical protein